MQSRQTKSRQDHAAEFCPSKKTYESPHDADGALCGCMNSNETPSPDTPLDKEHTSKNRLIRALANPLEVRLDVELIRDLGVSEKQARTWMDEPEFQAAVDEELKRRCGEARSAVWRSLIREALRGSFQHIKLYLELTGDLKPRVDEPEGLTSPVVIIRPEQT